MASTSSTPGANKPTSTRKSTGTRRSASTSSRSRTSGASRTRRNTSSTQARTRVDQVQDLANRAVLVPLGVSLVARDNLVSSVKGVATKYRTRAGLEREIKRYERRGASARNRFERQVRRTRTKFERELRQRRTRLERDVRSVRRDLGKQSDALSARVKELIGSAS